MALYIKNKPMGTKIMEDNHIPLNTDHCPDLANFSPKLLNRKKKTKNTPIKFNQIKAVQQNLKILNLFHNHVTFFNFNRLKIKKQK